MVPGVATTLTSKNTATCPGFKGATEYSCQGERHGGGKRGDWTRERRQERVRQGRNEEGNGERRGRRKRGRQRGQRRKTEIRYSGMCKHTGRPTSGKVPIRFGTYNIRNGRDGGLEATLQGMSQANMDLGIFQETKLTDRIYTRG